MFNPKLIFNQAKKKDKTIVFPEAGFSERIVEAGSIIAKKKIARVVFVGDESALVLKYPKLKNITIVNPKTSSLTGEFVTALYELRKAKGLTEKKAKELILNPVYFATMMVHLGYADGMVGGAETSTADNLRPALQIIKGETKDSLISSANILYGKNKILGKDSTMVLADCALNINPTAEELAKITIATVDTAKKLAGINPKVAMLSFSTKGSAESPETKKVAKAYALVKAKDEQLDIDGEVQMDVAVVPFVASIKAPNSPIQGNANVLIFPELQSGNICYKAIERFGNCHSIGPIIQGLKKPVNDLSRGCNVKDIITLTALTVLQCKD